jgi:hypothetical protein
MPIRMSDIYDASAVHWGCAGGTHGRRIEKAVDESAEGVNASAGLTTE